MLTQTRIVVAAVLLLCTLVAHAADEDDDQFLLQLEQAEMRLEHANARLQHHRNALSRIVKLPAEEQIGQLALLTSSPRHHYQAVLIEQIERERAVDRASATVQLRELDLEEMLVAGSVPADGLWAPIVNERDFAGDRLRVHLDLAVAQYARLKKRFDAAQWLVNQRALPWRDQSVLADDLDIAEDLLTELTTHVDMRNRFLNDKLPENATFVMEEEELDRRQRRLERRLERATVHLHEVAALVNTGYATLSDLEPADLAVLEITQRIESIQLAHRLFDLRFEQWRRDIAERDAKERRERRQ